MKDPEDFSESEASLDPGRYMESLFSEELPAG